MNNSFLIQAREIFNKIPFVKTLDLELVDVTENSATAKFIVQDFHANYIKGLHGGVIAGAIDTVVFFPYSLIPSGVMVTTSGFDIKFFRPAKIGDEIVIKAHILYAGNRRINVEGTAFLSTNNQLKIMAKANVDLMKI